MRHDVKPATALELAPVRPDLVLGDRRRRDARWDLPLDLAFVAAVILLLL